MTLLAEAKQTELFGEELGRRVFLRPHWENAFFSGELGIGKQLSSEDSLVVWEFEKILRVLRMP